MKRLKKVIFLALIFFLILSIIPYLFPVENRELKPNELPFKNSMFVSAGDVKVHFRCWFPEHKQANHKAILLLHGFSGSTFSFRKNASWFAKQGYLVLTMDIPPFGYSGKAINKYNAAVFYQSIIRFINSQTKFEWVFVGHSLGASYVSKLAGNLHQAKKMILIDGLPSLNNNNRSFSVLLSYPPVSRWAEVIGKAFLYNENTFAELLQSAYGNTPEKEDVQGYLNPFHYENMASAIIDFAAVSESKVINHAVNPELLIIWGREDEWIPVDNFVKSYETFKLTYKKLQFFLIPEAGHCPMETHANLVNNRIHNFILN